MKKRKIAFVINEFGFFSSHRKKLVHYLSSFYDVTVITDLSNYTAPEENERYQLIHLENNKHLKNPFKFYFFSKKFLNIVNSIQPEHIFYVSLENCVFGAVMSRFLNVKKSFFLITGIGSFLEIDSLKKFLVKNIFCLCLRKFSEKEKTIYIFQNNNDAKDIENVISTKIEKAIIRGNGIDINYFSYTNRNIKNNKIAIKALYASRLLDEKGVKEFFDAAKELKNESHNIDFSIAGSYDKTNKLSISQKIFEEIQNSNEIKYLGNVENQLMRDLYHSHDIFILPSYREGLPVAALEAASTGMPLIMPNVPGCNECIINDCNGYLIEPRSIESLKKAIKEIYKNKFLISKFSKQSRLIIEKNFEISIIGKKYKEIIELNMS